MKRQSARSRPARAGAAGLLCAGVIVAVAAGSLAASEAQNQRERPLMPADTAPLDGLAGAFAELRIDKLARAFDELLTMPSPGALGGPRGDLSWRELIDFADGRREFRRVFTQAEGLGPGFNERSCAACHSAPVIGGGGRDMTFGVFTVAPQEDPKDTIGLAKFGVPGYSPPKPPPGTPQRRTPPLFGLGLLDAVPDAVLLARADPDDRDGDGIRGVLNERGHPQGGVRPARFGHKSNEPNLLRFIGGALRGEMGITNRASRASGGDDDKVPDPEAPAGFVTAIDAFVRGLAPPPRAAHSAAAAAGEAVFVRLGCSGCHAPTLGDVGGAFTDLLVHDLGERDSDGLYDGKAGPTQWRTPALWGLRHRARYLHDERADTIDAVVAVHGGEASKANKAYFSAAQPDRDALAAFLKSL